ncbi:MAG TPA: hypothetical protein VGF07_02010 [Stellaceae bacterium]|jgi:hypothetical protein
MRVRFFSDWGPNDTVRVLVGVSPDDPDRGQAREAVHVATQADIDAYPAAYADYEKTVEAAKAAASADTAVHTTGAAGSSAPSEATAPSETTTASASGGSRSSRSGGGSSGSSG